MKMENDKPSRDGEMNCVIGLYVFDLSICSGATSKSVSINSKMLFYPLGQRLKLYQLKS